MKLQRKTLLITSASAVFLFSIVYTTSAAIVWNGFASLERADIQEQTEQLRVAFQTQLCHLQTIAQGWVMQPPTASAFDSHKLASMGLDLVLELDEHGGIIGSQAVDRENEPTDLPSSLLKHPAENPLWPQPRVGEGLAGVIDLPEGPLAVALQRVPHGSPEPGRTVVAGKWLSSFASEKTGNQRHYPVRFTPFTGAVKKDAVSPRADADSPLAHVIVDRDWAEGYFVMSDPHGQPALLASVTIPRRAAAQGRACVLHMLVGLLAAGVGFALIVRRVVNKIVLSRLLALVNSVRRFSGAADPGQLELSVEGNDELTDLALAVNEMARDLCLLRDVSDTANAADSKAAVALQCTLDQICNVLDWQLAHACFVDGEDSVEQPRGIWNRDMDARFLPFLDATTAMCQTSHRGLIDRVVDSRQSVWMANVQTDKTSPRRSVASQVGIQAAFGIPICVGNTVVAVVEMFSLRAQNPDPGMIRIAEQIASQIGRVFERNRIARELVQLHTQLADLAHQEGMAEVATNVLHNVGNVLNSVNVSAALIRDIIDHSEMKLFRKAIELLEEHPDDLGPFIEHDEKGRYLPKYLITASRRLDNEFSEIDARVESLEENVDHIKTIISMQQAYARVRGTQQSLAVSELLDDALHLYKDAFASHGIEVVRHYDPVPQIEVDRHRLMQIINNLLKNAQESLDEVGVGTRQVRVIVTSAQEGWVQIMVEDTGSGITQENLGKVFTYGFTTKETGHGFGLHGCANSIKEMGGAIHVCSPGSGKGATFTIKIPVVLEGVNA